MNIDEKREKNRLKNLEWRRKNPKKYLKNASKYRKNNRNKIREYKLKLKYGLSLEEYEIMFTKQNGKCAICGEVETAKHSHTKKIINLAVDHCHTTGKVRELLCQDCNRGLGKFKDDPVRLKAAIEYIKKHN